MFSFRLISLLLLTSVGVHGFGIRPQQQELEQSCSRRDALSTIGLLSATLAAPAAHALDLSQYKDGPNGLKYLVTADGSGDSKPQRGQKVRTSYSLYLNGFPDDDAAGSKQIDSSKSFLGEKPFEFNVGVSQVIKGWDLSLLEMTQGEARRLVIPASLGYGDKGFGSRIPGGSTLYFEMQLVELGKKPELTEDQMQWLEEHPL